MLIIRQVLNLMGDLKGCAQRPDAGVSCANNKLGLCRLPPLTRGNTQGSKKDHYEAAP